MKLLSFISILMLCSLMCVAQEWHPCSKNQFHQKAHQNKPAWYKGTILHSDEDNYDIHYVKLDLKVNNNNLNILGSATVKATNILNQPMSFYAFELEDIMSIDSIVVNNHLEQNFSRNGHSVLVDLDQPINPNEQFTALIYYHGTASNTIRGYRLGSMEGESITFTLSEPYGALSWWPCKQSLTDKIDSLDVWLTVPKNCKSGTNGILKQIVDIDATQHQFQWQHRHPIDYYLVSMATAPYEDYSYYSHFPNGDSVYIQNYVLPGFESYQSQLDSIGDQVQYFSQVFGRYPFWDEKYGHCLAPIGGGMEHQTMTTQSDFRGWLTAHELAHQWFGNYVTCKTWKDIWINEGFASYGEYLYEHHFNGPTAALQKILDVQQKAKDSLNGTLYKYDTTNVSYVFNSYETYHKGSAVVHMLRYVINNDTLFYNALKNFLNEYRYQTASTEDIKTSLSRYTGIDFNDFFEQWIYQPGYPLFNISLGRAHNGWHITVAQQNANPNGVQVFKTPVDFEVITPNGNTHLRLMLDSNVNHFFIPTTEYALDIVLDKNNWLLKDVQTKQLFIQELAQINTNIKVYPNPTKENWQIDNLTSGSELQLYNSLGQLIFYINNSKKNESIDTENLPNGVYFLKVKNANNNIYETTLLKH